MATYRLRVDAEPALEALARVTLLCRQRRLTVQALDYARSPAAARITIRLDTGSRPPGLVTAQLARVPGVREVSEHPDTPGTPLARPPRKDPR